MEYNFFYKIFDRQLGGFSSENFNPKLKIENFMWGVSQEARGWNVGAVCSDFNLAEPI